MVLKLAKQGSIEFVKFESDVISDGTQTLSSVLGIAFSFESDVISDGTQTLPEQDCFADQFESDVISDGTQTPV